MFRRFLFDGIKTRTQADTRRQVGPNMKKIKRAETSLDKDSLTEQKYIGLVRSFPKNTDK